MDSCCFAFWTSVAHCTVLYKDKPVVLGGDGDDLSTCEEFDPAANTWKTFPSYNAARSRFGAAVVDGKIYIAGGYGNNLLDSIEVFDGAAWSVISARLASPRDECAAVCLGNKLVVLGGYRVDTVEVYDPATNAVSSVLISRMKVNPQRICFAAVSF